eukprot:m.68867 g.68867  ORF g.68867 m.68867 type:complete len:54 (+) comp35565_c0_seq1:127-288(+)
MIDPTQQLALNILVNHTLTSVAMGYDGSWFDLFGSGEHSASTFMPSMLLTWEA